MHDLVEQLLKEVGPACYRRTDLRLTRPISKKQMSDYLLENAPAQIGGEAVEKISTMDGIKYWLKDGSWLLIRPSGTEPVLRVYAEGRSPDMLQAMMQFGEQSAHSMA